MGIRDSGLTSRFEQSLTTILSPNPQSPIPHLLAVALSGGVDSMALTLLAQDWVQVRGGTMVALTVDHRLRPESTAEALQVAQWMQQRGIAHHILTPEHTSGSNNVQESARAWRYAALAEHCRDHGILHCLLAHQAGDNRETVAHHLARGDTADGASGMARVRNFHGVRFLRPLLGVERTDLAAFLQQRHAPWVDDPSNQNPRFARVRTRRMLEQNPMQAQKLDALIQVQSAQRTARDYARAEAAIHCVRLHPLGFADMSLSAWQGLESTLASQLLADILTTIGGHGNRPRASNTVRLMDALNGYQCHQPPLKRTLAQCEITLRGDHLRIAREAARVAPPLPFHGHGIAVWDNRFRVYYACSDIEGFSLRALGAEGRRQLRAIQPSAATLPLASPSLWHLDELQFVPYIGMPHPSGMRLRVGFAPPKPLAAAPFW